jgi:hypothetical protein
MNEQKMARTSRRRWRPIGITIENNARRPMNRPSPNGDKKITIFGLIDAIFWKTSVS